MTKFFSHSCRGKFIYAAAPLMITGKNPLKNRGFSLFFDIRQSKDLKLIE
jgi:hypothetical protein